MVTIRLAVDEDIPALIACDPIAQREDQRKAFIRRAVGGDCCYIALAGGVLAGYGVLEYSFFENGFISMLYVCPEHRRQGGGTALMRHMASQCRTQKLFTSTNLSNLPMQSLLAKLGYRLSGVIQDLDEGDPELVYINKIEK